MRLIFALLFVFQIVSIAQINYLPLQLGNEYQYCDCQTIDPVYGPINVITSDSTFTNGKTYFYLPWLPFEFLRSENGSIYVPNIPYPGYEQKDEYIILPEGLRKNDRVLVARYLADTSNDMYVECSKLDSNGSGKIISLKFNYFGWAIILDLNSALGVVYYSRVLDDNNCLNYAKIINNTTGQIFPNIKHNDQIASEFILGQNYPNPFNPSTTIAYRVAKESFVSIKVYDLLGCEVMTLVNENKKAGDYSININGANLKSGVYFYKICAGSFTATKKMILIK